MLKYLFALLVCLLAAPASAATYYVAQSGGSNANPCTGAGGNNAQNIAFAKATVTGANGGSSCLSGGDTLVIRAGDYNDYFDDAVANHGVPSGTAGAPTRIVAYPGGCSPRSPNTCGTAGEDVTLRPLSGGNGIVIAFAPYSSGVVTQYVEFDGINIDGRDWGTGLPDGGAEVLGVTCRSAGQSRANYITYQNAEAYTAGHNGQAISLYRTTAADSADGCPGGHIIRNIKLHGGGQSTVESPGQPGNVNGYWFYLLASNCLIENSEFMDSRHFGIHVNGTGGPTGGINNTIIRNNRIHDSTRGAGAGGSGGNYAVFIGSYATNTLVANNVLYSNGGGGAAMYLWDASTSTTVVFNTVYGTNGYGIWKAPGAGTATFQNNISYNSSSGNFLDQNSAQSTNSNNSFIGTDPVFMNVGTADFRLAMGSPMIDVGVCLAQVPTDAEGTARPQGLGCDIGADEYLAAGSLPGVVACTPANGATGIDLFPTIACTSSGATSFDVYFGLPGNTSTPLFSTTFTAANSADIGTDFTPYAAVGITNATLVSNRVRSVSTTAYSVEALTSVTLSADQWCRVQLVTVNNASQNIAGCLLRGSAPAPLSGYLVGIAGTNQTGSWIARVTNGLVDAYLATETATVWAVNDRIEARAVGNTLTLYRYPNTTPILTTTDLTYAAGRVGLVVFSTTVGALELDNFEAGNLGLPFLGNQTSGTYMASNLSPNAPYQYQFIAKNSVGDTPGPLNGFTTLGSTATPVGIRVRFKAP